MKKFSKNNVMMRNENSADIRHRFGFRKLASGLLVSAAIGAFFMMNGQNAQAASGDTTDKGAAAVEVDKSNSTSDTDSKETASDKNTEEQETDSDQSQSSDTQNEDTKTENNQSSKEASNNDASSKAANNKETEVNGSDTNSKNVNSENKETTKTDSNSGDTADTQKSSDADSTTDNSQKNSDAGSMTEDSQKNSDTNSAKSSESSQEKTKTSEEKQTTTLDDVEKAYEAFEKNAASMSDSEKQAAATELQNKISQLSAADQLKLATLITPASASTVDVNDWDYSNFTDEDGNSSVEVQTKSGVTYTGDVVIPNTADLIAAGIITDENGKAYITSYTLDKIATTSGVTSITISHDSDNGNDSKLYVKNHTLDSAFNNDNANDDLTTIDISNLDTTGVTSTTKMFLGNKNLTSIIGLGNMDVSSVTDMSSMFYNCNNLTAESLTGLSNWDVSKVTNMYYMFGYMRGLTDDLSFLSNWKTDSLTNLTYAFQGDTQLKSLHGLENWNVSGVTSLLYTFADNNSLTDISALKNWDVSNVTNMANAFSSDNSLTNLSGLENWKVSNVTNMSNMFLNENKLTDISALTNWDVSNVTNMANMFAFNNNLSDLSPLANWNVAKVTNMQAIFQNDSALTTDSLSSIANWDVSNITNMVGMFLETNLSGLVDLNWNLNSNVNTERMFAKSGTASPLMVIVKSGADKINSGSNAFNGHYLFKVDAGEGTLTNSSDTEPARAFNSAAEAKAYVENALKNYTATRDGYTFKDWTTAGNEYGTTGVYDLYKAEWTANPQSIEYQFVDDDENGAKVGSAITENGVTDQTITFTLNVPENYALADGQTLPTSYTFKASGNDPVTIHLVHKTKDTSSTDPDAKKTITRTINITNPDGTVNTTTQTANLSRTATLDLVTGKTTYGDWNTGSWESFTTPAIAGYTPSEATVAKVTVTADTKDDTVNITYTADPQSIQYQFVDDDENGAKVGDPITENGVTDQTINFTLSVPTNYDLASGQALPTSYKFKASGNDPVTIHLVHHIEDVSDTDPDAHKTITRTINVIDPNGTTETTTQTANLSRSAKKDMVTNKVTYGDWNTGTWESFTPKAIAGYTADPASVAAETVTADMEDTTVTIHYVADPVPDNPDQPTSPTQPTNVEPHPEQPTTPAQPTTVKPHGENTPAKKNNAKSAKHVNNSIRPLAENSHHVEKNAAGKVGDNQAVKAAAKIGKMNKTAKAALPQTGEKQNSSLGIIGLAIAALAGIIGLADRRKRN